ncbi:hypothetical protein JNUCC42_03755 [Brevibacterium sp. JNUCC-42]|nr:hypothetical protein JNUCC42_03755 [Brevibacterium sp. JNUCC-42]
MAVAFHLCNALLFGGDYLEAGKLAFIEARAAIGKDKIAPGAVDDMKKTGYLQPLQTLRLFLNLLGDG